ncbi:hypothetical protein MBLNU13_g08655t1 [Cladosporium sp. NU13]
MVSKIIIVRHDEYVHNASSILKKLPSAGKIAKIISSPLRRAIQTTLAGFSTVLDKQYFDKSARQGIDGGATLSLDPDLQERSDLLCDMGPSTSELQETFPSSSFDDLGEEWLKKSGRYAPNDDAVLGRAERVRQRLFEITEALQNEK